MDLVSISRGRAPHPPTVGTAGLEPLTLPYACAVPSRRRASCNARSPPPTNPTSNDSASRRRHFPPTAPSPRATRPTGTYRRRSPGRASPRAPKRSRCSSRTPTPPFPSLRALVSSLPLPGFRPRRSPRPRRGNRSRFAPRSDARSRPCAGRSRRDPRESLTHSPAREACEVGCHTPQRSGAHSLAPTLRPLGALPTDQLVPEIKLLCDRGSWRRPDLVLGAPWRRCAGLRGGPQRDHAAGYLFASHRLSTHDCVQQSALEWQITPRSRHWAGCRLVAPGSTFVVLDELKQLTESNPRAESPRAERESRRREDRMPLEEAK
jgi:hypothetical protein